MHFKANIEEIHEARKKLTFWSLLIQLGPILFQSVYYALLKAMKCEP
jgi:hypothetical protein